MFLAWVACRQVVLQVTELGLEAVLEMMIDHEMQDLHLISWARR